MDDNLLKEPEKFIRTNPTDTRISRTLTLLPLWDKCDTWTICGLSFSKNQFKVSYIYLEIFMSKGVPICKAANTWSIYYEIILQKLPTASPSFS